MEVDDFEAKTEVFLSWLSQMGVKINPKMALVDMRSSGRGRGAIAVADFGEDEVVFSIPRSAVLNIATTATTLDATLRIAISGMPPWLALSTIMLAQGSLDESKWSPYFAVLPRDLDSLVFWSEAELAELQASTVVSKIGKLGAEEMFSKHIAPLGLPNASLELCHRVSSTIMAYAFDIPEKRKESDEEQAGDDDELVSDDEEDEKTTLSMIPLADMLNADADKNNARLCCDNEDLEMRTIKPITKGEEIFNDYGDLPRADLLRRYGYITPNYAPYDVAEISTDSIIAIFKDNEPISLPEQGSFKPLGAKNLQKRIELAERENVYEESFDIYRTAPDRPSIPDELLALTYLLLLDDEHLRAIETSETSLPSRSKLATELVGHVLAIALRRREKEYATTIEEDEALLQAGNISNRAIMAIHVRIGEKMVLQEAISDAESYKGSNKRMRMTTHQPAPEHTTKGQKRKVAETIHQTKKARHR